MTQNTQVTCPGCGTTIDVQDILAHQLEKELTHKFEAKLAQEKLKFSEQEEKLNKEKQDFNELKKKENLLFQERLDIKLKEEKKLMEEKLTKKMKEEHESELLSVKNELDEKSKKINELNKTKAENEKLKREKEELREVIELENQMKMTQLISEEREKIRKVEEDKNEMKVKELIKQLEDQKKLTEEMKRKQEQGSMQLQGEVMELAIEEWLMAQFPLDTIEEIKKGARGGDCIQIVNTRSHQNCGSIYYESKRTKEFQSAWIEKFKADIRIKGANIGVLVTDAMPSGMDRMGLKDGIWICSFEEFKGLCFVLRESIIQLSNAIESQENKGDKMHMLYDYLTGNTFRMQVEAIVEGFTTMKIELESEKRSMLAIWKKREKQIEKVTLNTIEMHSAIRGIAGSAIQTVKSLEMPYSDKEIKELGE